MGKVKKETEKDRNLFSLGDDESDQTLDVAFSDDSYLKLENDKGHNIFALLSPDFKFIQQHWIDKEGERDRVLCGVHSTNDPKIIAKGFSPDHCKFCDIVLTLYRQAKESGDKFGEKKKKLANDTRSKASVLYIATKGEANKKRVGSKRVLEPFFDTIIPGYLQLTESSSEMLRSEFRGQGFSGKDAIGLPVNFERGKKTSKAIYSQVMEVQFFPKFRIKEIPEKLPDFSGFAVWNDETSKDLKEKSDKWLKDLGKLLASRDKKSEKKKTSGRK